MTLYEYVGNLHMHTTYSDGYGSHQDIADAAIATKLDFVVVTDHNIYLDGIAGYYGEEDDHQVLLLMGEEVHDRYRLPQVNHCLVYNVQREMNHLASDPQKLIDGVVQQHKGLAFLAHPYDKPIRWLGDDMGIGIPWVDWHVSGYTGLEIWNYMACWKDSIPTVRSAFTGLFRPEKAVVAPRTQTLAKWDALLAKGQRVVGIGSSDAHAAPVDLKIMTHIVFPYDFLFNCVNTHVLTSAPFSGDMESDRALIFDAIAKGRCFVGYDLPASTRGFRFSAQGIDGSVEMGEDIRLHGGITLQVKPPQRAHIKIIRHGEVVIEAEHNDALIYTAREPGAYRAEVWIEYEGKLRCWILSNPIYILP